MKNQELIETVENLIDAGCNYRIDELEQLYAPELSIRMVQVDGSVLKFDYAQNIEFFRSLKNSGATPMDKTASFNAAEVQGDTGYVIVTRQMDLGGGPQKIVFNLMLSRSQIGRWQIFREHAVIVGEA